MSQRNAEIVTNDDDDESLDDFNFTSIDFSGVNFHYDENSFFNPSNFPFENESFLSMLGSDINITNVNSAKFPDRLKSYIESIQNGDYVEVLKDAHSLFRGKSSFHDLHLAIHENLHSKDSSIEVYNQSLEFLLVGIAAFSLFLQINYTGPVLSKALQAELDSLLDKFDRAFVLSELAADGEICCSIVEQPYLLLLSRSVFHTLALPKKMHWAHGSYKNAVVDSNLIVSVPKENDSQREWNTLVMDALKALRSSNMWCGRSCVAHQRLLHVRTMEPSPTLWDEASCVFKQVVDLFSPENTDNHLLSSRVLLEWGLAQHHFEYNDKGKNTFQKALELSGLTIELTGADGKRTKYQKESKAQLLIRTSTKTFSKVYDATSNKNILPERIEFNEDSHLLEQINFEERKDNLEDETLSMLHQSVLLALCLDVKNENPMDELTCETRMAYLERVLYQPSSQKQQQDWMIYATTLLERAWLEYTHKSSAKERALLQMQALVDQHTERLTITQSTVQSAVTDSAPAQIRLKNIHVIVYPPRWAMKADLAEKYARLGIVTTAAELFTEVEMWDDVVECYRRAGRENTADEVVRKQLEVSETPRMWAALGDITKNKTYYEKALEVSNNKYATAFIALGRYYFEHNELKLSSEMLEKGLDLKPLMPGVWFLLGTISMRTKDWGTALKAFSEVVQQEPEEADAWANVAAIHMHNKDPARAFPALNESIKYLRSNWRVWMSKLYVCLDLRKYDEAIQCCQELLNFKMKMKDGDDQSHLIEEKCIRGIVGGVVSLYETAKASDDVAALDSAKRTLSRFDDLMKRISTNMASEPWIWEVNAVYHEKIGGTSEEVLIDLQKEYRSLQSTSGWEIDSNTLSKIFRVASSMKDIYVKEGDKNSLVKSKFMLNGLIKKIESAWIDNKSDLPQEIGLLNDLLEDVQQKLDVLKSSNN